MSPSLVSFIAKPKFCMNKKCGTGTRKNSDIRRRSSTLKREKIADSLENKDERRERENRYFKFKVISRGTSMKRNVELKKCNFFFGRRRQKFFRSCTIMLVASLQAYY